ncbi:MAG: MOSC domain-containing protein [Rhodospirillales bacterium]|nr:MOSC domain-containing protein [Rhodospirillales bacterium]
MTDETPHPHIAHLCRYPVKGLSAESLHTVTLIPGEGLPEDRRFALAHAGTRFDAANPEWLPKRSFLMLMKNERLALLESRYDAATTTLEIWRGGKRVALGALATPVGRAVIEDFFAAFMRAEALGKPKLVEAPSHMFSDAREKVVSLINLATVADLERVIGRPVDPLRFRGNVYLEGLPAWAEFDWVGRDIVIGEAKLRIVRRIPRCAATDVDPSSGARDMNIPRTLMTAFGHVDLGLYAEVTAGGTITIGDGVHLP